MNDNIHVKVEDSDADGLAAGVTADPAHVKSEPQHADTPARPHAIKSSHSPSHAVHSPRIKTEKQETVGGDITLKMEPGEPLKLSRKSSHKVVTRPPQLYSHLPDATAEAKAAFEVLTACTYANKYLGYTEPPLECDCSEEWDAATRTNHACGEDSDCINRATKMECDPDCGCGSKCQNQRFQRKQYANVSVIKTEKKGYGLRANVDLKANDFIFEYIGEVIAEPAFRRRMHQYDEEGIKHFYFMSLTKGEFVDATKKGNLGRFCNHSCNPNSYVDKWVVGEKLRMGIFAERNIKAGEELVFNYNVDRYGADPQPCYCGEPNCVGFIGGKTQTERATKLSWQVVEALGLEDADDWDTAVAKKPKKKKTGEDDEEYVNDMQPKAMDLNAVRKVMATLATCKEKWIAVKLLDRIQECNDEGIRYQVIRMHGYRILNNVLKTFGTDANVCLQVCSILKHFPSQTRNKIVDAGIDQTVDKLAVEMEDEDVKAQMVGLREKWAGLEMGFRIRKIKRDPNAVVEEKKPDRRDAERTRARSRSRSKSPDIPKGPAAPTGPRNNIPQRGPGFPRPPPFRGPRPGALPDGWFQAVAANGSTYFYNATGETTWQRPTQPALNAPPPPPPKAVADQEILQNLINNIIASKKDSDKPSESSGTATPTVSTKDGAKSERKEDRWKSYPEEKRKKLYENTIAPLVSYVMNKYKKYLERDELKRFGKQIAKKIVDSDFKKGRVRDPRQKLDHKAERALKSAVKEFFDKVIQKQKERKKHEAQSAAKAEPKTNGASPSTPTKATPAVEDDIQLSDNEVEDDEVRPSATPVESDTGLAVLKRSRDGDEVMVDADHDEIKRAKTDGEDLPLPPPPPPPPSAPPPPEEAVIDDSTSQAMAAQDGEPMDVDSAQEGAFLNVPNGASKFAEALQTATPPTTDSPDHGDSSKVHDTTRDDGLLAES